jgi:glycosyltransferase involved in cell wall biosynthesis
MIENLCRQVEAVRAEGHQVVVVSSGAVAAGVAALGLQQRPTDLPTLQALAALGQPRMIETWIRALAVHGAVAAQVLLVPHDFVNRRQYLHARQTLVRLLELGCVPVVNENDAIADDEIRFGDNDRLAALVAHLVSADVLVLLTDLDGLYTADPKAHPDATLMFVGPPGPGVPGVTYHTGVNDTDLATLYRRAWVYASPSTYEGFGLPYLEAMASGTAVVATPNPGSREVLGDGDHGRLAEDASFGGAVVELLGSEDRRRAIESAGALRAQQFSLDVMVDRYEALLMEMCGLHAKRIASI